ncbi:hypothetical protein DID88_006196 [Monilinia fructigena]|uniref:Response regulatory domain-containing protein n=1 Tax=Monilinia fructigena TaxID=38457 RepID=A0A395J2N6_9HELO|nr:hypothetical protein DID88_006196 [Monilinia fructigena]
MRLFVLLYSVAETSEASNPLPQTTPSPSVPCSLEGSVGIPEGHSIAPSTFDIAYDQNWLTEPFKEAMDKIETIFVPLGSEVKQKLGGIKCRGFGEPTHVVVCPLMDSDTQSVLAFLVLALNPRRPYDIKIIKKSQANFARFATRTPVGLAILAVDGTALSANDLWRSQTKLDVGSSKVNWEGVLMPGEFESVMRTWAEVVEEKKARTLHTRIDKPWKAPELNIDGEEQWTESHLILAMYPDLDNEGNVSTIMSCITDISELKWSENQLRARMEQALEMKKQQERFIDMTSHEMRNPLSALIGCADEILFSLHEYKDSIKQFIGAGKIRELLSAELPTYLIDDAIEATDTIITVPCIKKRIIDDILTLSRLDSNLLVVSPEASQPKVLVKSLRKEGFAVIVANHGDEALEFLKETEFWVGDGDQGSSKPKRKLNLILMDLEMPVMDGITCVKQIRRWEREGMIKGHVPIIAVTANARRIERLVRRYHENRIETPATDTRTLGARTADLRTSDTIQADSNTQNGSQAGRITGLKD